MTCDHDVASNDVCQDCKKAYETVVGAVLMAEHDFHLESRRRILRLEKTVRSILGSSVQPTFGSSVAEDIP